MLVCLRLVLCFLGVFCPYLIFLCHRKYRELLVHFLLFIYFLYNVGLRCIKGEIWSVRILLTESNLFRTEAWLFVVY